MLRRLEFVLPSCAALWLVGILTIAVAFGPTVPPPLSAQWATSGLKLEVAAPSSPPMDLSNHNDPRSRYHISRFRLGAVPVQFNKTLHAPVSLTYEVHDAGAGERRVYKRTIPPGLSKLELPFYLGDRRDELATESVTCTLIKADGYELGSQATVQVDFLARENSALFETRTGTGQTAQQGVVVREWADPDLEIYLKAESPVSDTTIVNLTFKGTAADDNIFQLPENASLRFDAGQTESNKLKLRVAKALDGHEYTLTVSGKADVGDAEGSKLAIGSELDIRVVPAAAPRFIVNAPDSVSEGEQFKVTIDLASGEIPPDGAPLDFRPLNTRSFAVDASSPKEFLPTERSVTIHAKAVANKIAFDDGDYDFVLDVNGQRLVAPIAVLDKSPRLLSITPSTAAVNIAEGSPHQWDLALPESVIAAQRVMLHATITAVGGAELGDLKTQPPFEVVDGTAKVEIPLAALTSSTTLTVEGKNNDKTNEPDKQYVVRFLTEGQPWTAVDSFPEKIQLTVVDDDQYNFVPATELAVVESNAPTNLVVLHIDPPVSAGVELRFKVTEQTVSAGDYTIGLPRDERGFYHVKIPKESVVVSIPFKANMDGLPEPPEELELVFDSAKIVEPIPIEIEDGDVVGDVAVLLIATPAIESTLEALIKGIDTEFEMDVLVANKVYVVDNSVAPYVDVSLDGPLPKLAYFDNDASPELMDKTIAAWRKFHDRFAGQNRQLRRTVIVWKSSFPGDTNDDYLGWKDRPDNNFHVIWIGGQSGEGVQTSKLIAFLTTLEGSGEAKLPLIPYRQDFMQVGNAAQKLLKLKLPTKPER